MLRSVRGKLTTDPTDAPSLLNRAGFTTTTVDVEDLTISYPSIWELMQDLRDMGESNAILGRRGWVSRDVLLAAEGIYKGEYLRAIASRRERVGDSGREREWEKRQEKVGEERKGMGEEHSESEQRQIERRGSRD
jgi:hypothetical protein